MCLYSPWCSFGWFKHVQVTSNSWVDSPLLIELFECVSKLFPIGSESVTDVFCNCILQPSDDGKLCAMSMYMVLWLIVVRPSHYFHLWLHLFHIGLQIIAHSQPLGKHAPIRIWCASCCDAPALPLWDQRLRSSLVMQVDLRLGPYVVVALAQSLLSQHHPDQMLIGQLLSKLLP